jgi:hypothetical protein
MATLGNTTAGADDFPCSGDRGLLSSGTATEDGTCNFVAARFFSGSSAGTSMKGLIYADNGADAPTGPALAVGAATAVPAGGGIVQSNITFSLVNGTKYWFGYVNNGSDCRADIETSGKLSRREGLTYATPGSWTEDGTSSQLCAWIDYTPGGGGGGTNRRRRLLMAA